MAHTLACAEPSPVKTAYQAEWKPYKFHTNPPNAARRPDIMVAAIGANTALQMAQAFLF
jgi:hypothetical protein